MGNAVDPQAGHAAIGIDVQAQVGPGAVVGDGVIVVAVALHLDGGQYLGPGGIVGRVALGAKAGFQ